MAIKRNVLAESGATVQAEDGSTMYATIQMRHGNEADMDKSKFVPAEIGVATDTKKAFVAFAPGEVKEIMFREDSEIEELLEEVRDISDQAVEAVESAEASAKQAIEDYTDQMKATIPEDYTEMVKKVDVLERTKAPAIMQTVSGESLQIEDSADAPMAGLRVFGRSGQVVTTGAQLAQLPDMGTTINGVTFTVNEEGCVIANGTAAALTVFQIPIPSQPSTGEFYLSGCPKGGSIDTYRLDLRKENNSALIIDNGSGGHGQISEKASYIGVRIAAGYTANNVVFHPMLNSGSTALPLEPYTGGKPSPSPDYPQEIEVPGSEGSVGVNVTGNQLLDIRNKIAANNTGVSVSVDGTGGITINGTPSKDSADIYLAGNWNSPNIVFPADTYTLSCDGATSDERLSFIKGTSASSAAGNSHITTTNDITGIFIRLLNGKTYTNFKIYPMLNKGSVALPFEPYKNTSISISTPNGLPGIPVDSGGNYTDSDGQQWVCDEVDFDRGKYVQRVKKVVYDGSEDESWLLENNTAIGNRYLCYFEENVKSSDINKSGVFSMNSNFPLGRNGRTWHGPNLYTIYKKNVQSVIYVSLNGTETLEEFKQYLSQHPMTVICVLETPVETDLSEEELTAYAALRTNYPTTIITVEAGELAPEIEVEYVADTKTYIDNKFAELAQNLAATQNTLLEV